MRTWSLRLPRQLFRLALSTLHMLATAASVAFKSRSTLHLENLALRHQLSVLRRSVKRPKLTSADRLLWAWLCEVWIDWRSSLVIVKPETVIGWHRKGFRLFWTWKVRHGQPGRPPVSKEIRQLIRKMSRENLLWGAPRIHGELLKLGIDIGETSVGKYIGCRCELRSRHPDRVEVHADQPAQSVQRAPAPGRGDRFVCALVSPVSALLRARRRTGGRTSCRGGDQLHLALGAGLCTGAEQTLPTASQADEQELSD